MNGVEILGVHAIEASVPVHLIEMRIPEHVVGFDWDSITQPIEGEAPQNWQVAYDEQPVPGSSDRWVFFFHYLDPSQPLSTAAGDLALPDETPIPDHLRFIRYEQPY